MSNNQEAWHQFFGQDYLLFSEVILSPERTQYEVSHILEALSLPARASILDLGCGQGRISIPMAERGFNVTGYDGAPELIAAAQLRAIQAGVDVQFILGDMRELNMVEQFDAVINVGTAFGYVPEEEDDQEVLDRVYRALKPGGWFLQEMENRDFKLQGLRNTWDDMNGRTVFSRRQFNSVTGRWNETISWYENGEKKSSLLDLRLYTATEITRMTEMAGLNVMGVYGGVDRSPLTVRSPRMMILSRKG